MVVVVAEAMTAQVCGTEDSAPEIHGKQLPAPAIVVRVRPPATPVVGVRERSAESRVFLLKLYSQ